MMGEVCPKSAIARVGPDVRLAAAADLGGDADGLASTAELARLAKQLEALPADLRDAPQVQEAKRRAAKLLSRAEGAQPSLDPTVMRRLPPGLRRLALEVDGLWGNADGKVDVAELDRVARLYLAALPFFAADAEALLALAEHLGLAESSPDRLSLAELRVAVEAMAKGSSEWARPFRALLDEAIAARDAAGVPQLLREAVGHDPKWHQLGILEHTAVAVAMFQELATVAGVDWRDGAAVLLLHDIGKILRRQMKPRDGRLQFDFKGHEALGADWLAARGASADLVFHVRHHEDVRLLTLEQLRTLVVGRPDRLAQMILIYLADSAAKGKTPAQLESFTERLDKVATLCREAGLPAQALLTAVARLRDRHFRDDAGRM